ncbi:MAG: hypothetical protein ACSHW1_15840 [Yoonia sp.]
MNKASALALVAFTLTLPALSLAQAQGQPPQGPDFAAIGADLNIAEATVQACFPEPEQGERPAAGERPAEGERPEGPDMTPVISCLQSANGSLTGAQIDAVLRDHRPEPPQRG